MIIFLYGADTFRSYQKLKGIKNAFLKKIEGGNLNLAEIDNNNLTFADFKKEVSTMPFIAKERMVIFKNIISQNKKDDLQQQIIQLLKTENYPQENVIIFIEDAPDKRKALFKYLTNKKNPIKVYQQEFNFLNDMQLKKWIIQKVTENNAEINGQAVGARHAVPLLINKIGNNLWQMNNEINKLASYDKNISIENINALVRTKDDDNIFNLTDAIGNKNKKLAFQLLAEQLHSGANIMYIMVMLTRQYRLLLEIKDYLLTSGNVNSSSYEISGKLKMHPFVVQKLLSQARLYDMSILKKIYNKILQIDVKSKTTNLNIETLLDMMIVSY
ncbi:DNA polymerase III subunit delta [Patescibacteria group bacterium]